LDDERIELETRPHVALNEEGEADGTPSCINKPTMFSFDIGKNTE
jgi:hypothetical protein